MPAQTSSPVTLDVDVVDDDGDWSALPQADVLVAQAAAAVAAEPAALRGRAGTSFCATVALSSDVAVAALNGQYRGKAKPTNVLSFPAGAGSPPDFLGDIILAIETLMREARDQQTLPEHHLQHLTVHGLLHLLGFDHETSADAERMEGLEILILARLGIANPYTGALETGTSEDRADRPLP